MRDAHNKTKPDVEQQIVSLYLALHSPKDIVTQLGVSSTAIDRVLRRRGTPRHFKTAHAAGVTEKRCRGCGVVKSESEFPKAGKQSKHCKIRSKCKKCSLEVCNRWRNTHRDRVRFLNRTRAKASRATNVQYKISQNLRRRIREAVIEDEAIKSAATFALVGCSVQSLTTRLESLFKPGMTWENYGLKGWHIDHIKPCAKFNLTDPEQQRVCFHWTNLQPLWATENMSKGSR